ncbi:MAG: LysR substrate-binding domain-containing protein [Pseudomonadota bacterium]
MKVALSLKQLRYLSTVAGVGHFRKAADQEGITQPSLSAQIAALEEALGLRLLERGRGGVRLTMAGREILSRAERVLDEVRGLEDQAKVLRSGSGGTLRLGTSITIGPYLLPRVVGALHQNYPQMGLHVREGAADDLEFELTEGRYDAILTQLPVRSPDLEVEPIFSEALAAVVASDHPFAALSNLSNDHLSGIPILTLGQSYGLHTQVRALCSESGARLLQNYEGTSLDGLRQMAGMGMGVTFLPALYIRSEIAGRDGDVTVVRFRKHSYRRVVALAWRRSTGPMALVKVLAQQLRLTLGNQLDDMVALV